MSSRRTLAVSMLSIVAALALVGCKESSVSGSSGNQDNSLSSHVGILDDMTNSYSYSRPETSDDSASAASSAMSASSHQRDSGQRSN